MIGRSKLMSWTTGDNPTAPITRFSKRSGSLPPISAEPHGSAGGSEPAGIPQFRPEGQERLTEVRLRVGGASPRRGWGLVQDPRERLPHGVEARRRDVCGAQVGEKRGDEAVEDEVTSCERVEAVPGPRRVDELKQFLGVVGHERWSGPTVCEEEAQIGARCQRACADRVDGVFVPLQRVYGGPCLVPEHSVGERRKVPACQEPCGVQADEGLTPVHVLGGAAVAPRGCM